MATQTPAGSEGPLAEYKALRTEIDANVQIEHTLATFQLTSGGAFFAFVLAHADLTLLLLIIPGVSYLLAARYMRVHYHILHLAEYMANSLSNRVPGGVLWEWWAAENPRAEDKLFVNPTIVAFAGIPTLALVGSLPRIVRDVGAREWSLALVGQMAAWMIGFAAVIQIAISIRRARKQFLQREWVSPSTEEATSANWWARVGARLRGYLPKG